jgi:ATP phosphoribosyltransferase
MDKLTVALPKGRMQDEVLALFAAAGYPTGAEVGRKLFFDDDSGRLRFMLAKPGDVPTYVEYGAADLGVAGLDVLREGQYELYEPLGLGVGRCRLALAGPPSVRQRNLRLEGNVRVASKYPRLAREYFQSRGITAEVIYLTGSIELAPAVGIADLLVDLVQTGRTLVENGLAELETILASQAMLVVNPASHKLRFAEVQAVVAGLGRVVAQRALDAQERGAA